MFKPIRELTFHDRLSHLTHTQACRLIGPGGKALIANGSRFEKPDPETGFKLSDRKLVIRLPKATVTLSHQPDARGHIAWKCSACNTACDHVGVAFSFILEDKAALGLSIAPDEHLPIELLDENALEKRMLTEREQRAKTERMRIKAIDSSTPWSDYLITNPASGKTYRVAIRGLERGESYCSCPDFHSNTLGTCKHIIRVIDLIKTRFSKIKLATPYLRKRLGLHVRYGHTPELRLLIPNNLDPATKEIIAPISNIAIANAHDLIDRLRRLQNIGRDVMVYPDAEELMRRRLFQERIIRDVAAIRADPARHPLRTSLLKAELLPYQLDGIAFAVGAGRAVLADDMGLGKTIQGVGVAEFLAREANIQRVLVVCPTSLKSQWRSEITRFCDRTVQIVAGPSAERTPQYAGGAFFTICNYEQVLRDLLHIEKVKWDLIILDEGQRIKNWEARTSRVIKGLHSQFALVLSGTPLENRLEDLFSVMQFIDEHHLGPAFRFLHKHRTVDEKGKVLGYRNLDELRGKLRPILLRRTRDSVMQQLPPRTTEIVRIAPTEEQETINAEHMRQISQIVSKKFLTEMDLLRLQKHLLMCRMSADSTFLVNKEAPGFSSKLEQIEEILTEMADEKDRKVLLFSEWTTMLDLIEPILIKLKMPFVRLDGSVPQKKRQHLVNTFQKDPDCRLFITTNAGSTGLNLQAANTVINVDLPWNPAVLEQRIARAHRMGQKRPVQVFILVTERTIEENMLSTLALKKDLALAALDPESRIDKVDMTSGMEELKRRLELLLGAKPDAAQDESEKAEIQTQSASVEAQRAERVAAAGGQFLTAAFALIGEMMPQPVQPEVAAQRAAQIRKTLSERIVRDDKGRLSFSFILPNESALDLMANAMAQMTPV